MMPLNRGKESHLWSGINKTLQPIREETGVLQPQKARGRRDFRDLLIYLPHFRDEGKVDKGARTCQGHIARGKEDQYFSMDVRTYIVYFTIVTESRMSVSQESRKLWG